MNKSIEDLPEEILEYIFVLVSPYRDLQCCKLVCKKWYSVMRRAVNRRQLDLYRALKANTLKWHIGNVEKIPLRYSQASCYLDGTMYIFGGCSSGETTFNDLLAFDLTSRTVNRVLPTGINPSPKASATLCSYKNQLILFGGWTYPCRYAVHSPLIFYKELHVFNTTSRSWVSKGVPPSCPPCAGHSATVHGARMVVFGGISSLTQPSPSSNGSNGVSYLDLESWEWYFPEVSGVKPDVRFGHSQIYIDDNHVLIIGGSRDTSMPRGSLDDVWLLDISTMPWKWKQLVVQNPQWGAPHLWCNPVTRVGSLLVAFGRCAKHDLVNIVPLQNHKRNDPAEEVKEENVNGRHGSFSRSPPSGPDVSPERVCRGGSAKRQKQLEALAKYEKIFCRNTEKKDNPTMIPEDRPRMNLYSADVSEILTHGIVTWQEPKYNLRSPTNRIFYSLVAGNSELIMFGGMVKNDEDELPAGHNIVVQSGAWTFGVAPTWMP